MAEQKKQVEIPSYLRISKLVVWFLYFFVVLGIVSLVLRVFLLLFDASRTAGFSKLVADVSSDYLEPFRGIFPTKEVSGGYLDVSALFAILVYLFVLWGIHSLIGYVQNRIDISRAEQEQELARIQREKELELRSGKQRVNVRRTSSKKR